MRRRKERTLLTCITLVLLTFTVLSFTSIVDTLRKNDVLAPGTPAYQGILLRLPTWDALQEPAYRLLNDEYGRKYSVAPRAWYYGTTAGQQTFLKVSRADLSSDVKGVSGFTPQEADVTHIDKALATGSDGKPLGRWFNNSDTYSVLLPKGIADGLGISESDVKRGLSVNFGGVSYQVIGIIDPDKLKAIKDLDNESITPVDFISQNSQGQTSQGQAAASQGFQEYLHLDPNNIIYIPYRTLINMGGDLRSVAINFGNAATVRQQLFDPKTETGLMPRLDLNLYAGIGTQNHRFSAIAGSSSKGLVNVLIPILIASLIVLNTMLGSVYERVKEIAIFSSIGLSPNNIAMLFIARIAGLRHHRCRVRLLDRAGPEQDHQRVPHPSGPVPELLVDFGGDLHWSGHRGRAALHAVHSARKASEVATPRRGPHLEAARTRRRRMDHHPAVRRDGGAGAGHQRFPRRVVPLLRRAVRRRLPDPRHPRRRPRDGRRQRIPPERACLAGPVRPGRVAGCRAGHRPDRAGRRVRRLHPPDPSFGRRVQLETRQPTLPERRPQAVS